MKTNKELIQAAAKAAGIKLEEIIYFGEDLGEGCFNHNGKYWNPLEDSGIAINLAMFLRMTVNYDGSCANATIPVDGSRGGKLTFTVEGEDYLAAIRRAIVEAAASLSMNSEDAFNTLMRYTPCSHDTVDTRIGDGITWVKCEDCHETIQQKSLAGHKAAVLKFEDAISYLRSVVPKGY